MKVPSWITASALAFCSIALAATAPIDSTRYLDDVKFLASKEMKGRATGSPELEKAAAWIQARYKEFGHQAGGRRRICKPSR